MSKWRGYTGNANGFHNDTIKTSGNVTKVNRTARIWDTINKRRMNSPEGKALREKWRVDASKCFICNKPSLYRDYFNKKNYGACAQHKDQLPNKYKGK